MPKICDISLNFNTFEDCSIFKKNYSSLKVGDYKEKTR